MRLAILLTAAIVVFACSESTSPDAALGTYALTTVGGQSLPYVLGVSGPDTTLITGSLLRLEGDDTWLVLVTIRTTIFGKTRTQTSEGSGTWTGNEGVLTLTETNGVQTHTVALSEAQLTVSWYGEPPVMVYEKTATDNTPPTVLRRSPASGPNAMPNDVAGVAVTFNEVMDGRRFTASSFTLRGPGGAVAGTLDCGETWATWMFVPTAPLSPGQTYTATIAGTVTDLAGNTLGADVTWSFTMHPFAMAFVPVPAGTFQMGDQFDDGGSEERPVHSVTLTHGFNLGKYEVTQAQWRAVMGTNPAWHVNCEECPVEGASWEMGQQFIAALNAASGRAGCTTESGCYRLPTEAEWEYAAKGGPSGGDGTKWAGSTTVGDVAWYSANSGDATHPVGQKAPNGLGLYDMSGNVWEWVQDWYSSLYYSTSPGTDPGGPATGTGRGTRGGAYHLSAFASRVATRNHGSPTQTGAVDVGFRLVRVQ